MTRMFLTLWFLSMSIILFGKEKQSSLSKWREKMQILYPNSGYFTGYSSDNINGDKSQQEMKERAIGDISTCIHNAVYSEATQTLTNTYGDGVVNTEIIFKVIFSSITNSDVSGIKFEYYEDDKSVAVFAYVSQRELAQHYASQIEWNLKQIDEILYLPDQWRSSAEKVDRIRKFHRDVINLAPLWEIVKKYQLSLIVVCRNSNDDRLKESTRKLLREKENFLAQQKISVYMDFSGNEEANGIIPNKLNSELAEIGTVVVHEQRDADFLLTIICKEPQYAGNQYDNIGNEWYYYSIDTVIELFDNQANRTAFGDAITTKDKSRDPDRALEYAYKQVSKNIIKKITDYIKINNN